MSDRSKQIEEFKKEIRSILISAKDGLPLSKVGRDYYDFLGNPLPFRQLGFNSDIDLFSAVPDAVRLLYRGTEIFLKAVCNEKTAHIADMVSKQKKSNTGRAFSKPSVHRRRSTGGNYVPPRLQRSNVWKAPVPYAPKISEVSALVKKNVKELLHHYSAGLHIHNVKSAYKAFFGHELNHQDFNFVNLIDLFRSLHNENVINLNEKFSVIMPVTPLGSTYNQSERKENRTALNNHFEKEVSTTEREPNNEDKNATYTEYILENLKKVIKQYPNGFPMTELCENYKKITGSSLVLPELGYDNVQDLVSDLEDVFRVERNQVGEWILLDATLPFDTEEPSKKVTTTGDKNQKQVPDCTQQNIYDLLKYFSDGIVLEQMEELYEKYFGTEIGWKEFNYNSLESMLMSLEFNPPIRIVHSKVKDTKVTLAPKNVVLQPDSENLISPEQEIEVPEDAVIPGQVHITLKVPFEENDYFAVQVSTVETPGKIWLQMVSQKEQRNTELDDLMNDLADFYQSPEAEKYRIPEKYLIKGLNCAVLYPEDQDWHRGCILDKSGPERYEVLYYDYGTICVIQKDLLRLLKKSFAVLPAQAFCARLANIQPLSTFFSQESSSRLLELSAGKPLMAQITSTTYMNIRSVILCDTSGEDDVFLNDILVKEGLVEVTNDYVELRRPFDTVRNEVFDCSSNSHPQLPGSVMSSNPQIRPPAGFGLTPPTFHNPLASHISNISATFLQPFISTSASINTQIYHPPILTDLNQPVEQNNSILDLDILKRLEQRELARKNIPQATVEPLQISRAKMLEPKLTGPLRPETQIDANEASEQEAIQYNENSDNQESNRVYVSSGEDENQDNSRLGSSSASTISNPCARQLRYCKKVNFREDQFSAHLINFAREPCFNSGDVSSFIFGVDIVKRILQIQKYPACHIIVLREDQPAFFDELEKCEVTGFTKDDAKTDKIVLYALSDVLKILDFLNHDKETLVEDIEEFLQNFDPDDTYWITNDNSVKVNTYEDTLQNKLNDLREERKSILLAMLSEDVSSIQDTERLLQVNQHVIDLKAELFELRNQTKIKSATEQAREFLERVKNNFEIEKSPECSPVTTSSLSENTSVPVQVVSVPTTSDSNTACSSPGLVNKSNILPVGQSPIQISSTLASFTAGPRLPVVHALCPNFVYSPQYFTPTPYSYNQWRP